MTHLSSSSAARNWFRRNSTLDEKQRIRESSTENHTKKKKQHRPTDMGHAKPVYFVMSEIFPLLDWPTANWIVPVVLAAESTSGTCSGGAREPWLHPKFPDSFYPGRRTKSKVVRSESTHHDRCSNYGGSHLIQRPTQLMNILQCRPVIFRMWNQTNRSMNSESHRSKLGEWFISSPEVRENDFQNLKGAGIDQFRKKNLIPANKNPGHASENRLRGHRLKSVILFPPGKGL